MALAGDPDLLAVVDACRNLDLECPLLHRPPRSVTVETGPLDHPTGAATARAGLRADEFAERRPGDVLQMAATATGGADDRFGSRLCPASPTGGTGNGDRDRDSALDARRGLDELDLYPGSHVRPASAPGPSSDAEDVVAEEGREQVGEAAQVEARRCEAAAPETCVPVPVVELARLRLGENLVGLDDLAKPLLRVRRLGDVRMQGAREPSKRLLDRRLVGSAWHSEQLVVVALSGRHSRSERSSCPSCRRRSLRRSERARGPLHAPSGSPSRSPCAPGRGA